MKLKLFMRDGDGYHKIELPHLIASLTAWEFCHGDPCGHEAEVAIHQFTPAHARQLIEMLTPIAAEHKLKVEAEGRHVRFKCSCNLLGLLRDTQGEALEDFKTHVAEKAVTA